MRKVIASFLFCLFFLVSCSSADDSWKLSTSGPGEQIVSELQDPGGFEPEPGPRLDIYEPVNPDPYVPDPDNPNPESCENMDILFVIDNSCSMNEEQEKLVNNFELFVDQLYSFVSEVEELHIGVVTTDAYKENDPNCNSLGNLVTQNSEEICTPFSDGHRFMTQNDDLYEKFICAANVGVNGNGNEEPIQAAIQALEGFANSPGQCNENFSRPKTPKVLILITDEDDEQNAQVAFEHLEYLVHDERNIALITITKLSEDPPSPDCYTSSPSENLILFTQKFTNHTLLEICSDSWQNIIIEAVDTIARTCGKLPGKVPPAL